MPTPVNAKPLAGPPFVDDADGVRHAALLRRARGRRMCGAQAVESEASPRACVTPADTFPPAAPTSLTAVGGEGAVSLIWEANKEPDLAGYLVLRATLPGRRRSRR